MTLGHWRQGDSISRPFQETNLISANHQVSGHWLIIWRLYLFREFLKIIVLNIKYDGESQSAFKIELFPTLPKVIALTRSVKLKLPLKKN